MCHPLPSPPHKGERAGKGARLAIHGRAAADLLARHAGLRDGVWAGGTGRFNRQNAAPGDVGRLGEFAVGHPPGPVAERGALIVFAADGFLTVAVIPGPNAVRLVVDESAADCNLAVRMPPGE